MALYLPIRAISRSQQVRVGGVKITRDSTFYVDISDGKTRRDLERHQALGAVITVGSLSASDAVRVIEYGAVVTPQGSPDQTVDVSAGEIHNRETDTYVAIAAVDNLAASAASGANPRLDIVQVHITTGVATYKAGTAAATPVVATADTNNFAIATVARATSDNTIASADITDVRPRP